MHETKFYMADKPCKLGHEPLRYVANRRCVKCCALDSRKWYSNPANDERIRQKVRKYRERYPERVKAIQAKSRRDNKEMHRSATKRWRENNKEHFLQKQKEWWAANSHRRRAYLSLRRSRKRAAIGSYDEEDVKRLLMLQSGKCVCCRTRFGKRYCVDHIIALARGGTNERDNLQLLCVSCNSQKWAHDPIKFMQSRGYLL
jgi:5-methylcytosine-specific restriction endonuclease McrA